MQEQKDERMGLLRAIFVTIRGFFAGRSALMAENLALRQQLIVLQRSAKRPRLRQRDRVFWVWLSRVWKDWRSHLVIVKPETVIRWHRQGFKLYWRWKSGKGSVGRPKIDVEIRELIRRMSRENPTWGAPRILSELLLLGYSLDTIQSFPENIFDRSTGLHFNHRFELALNEEDFMKDGQLDIPAYRAAVQAQVRR